MSTTTESNIGENLRSMRLRLGVTQTELAMRAGIDRKTVNRIENFHYSPSIDTLVALAGALGVSPNELLSGSKEVR